MKPLELFIISLDHPESNSLWTTPSSLEGREDACALLWLNLGRIRRFQSCADSVAAVAATGVAGDVTEGKCSAVEEMQQRG